MRQRIDVRGIHVGVVRQIRGRIETGRRVAPLVPAKLIVVIEWIDVRGLHIRIIRKISGSVEEGVRVAPLLPAELLEVLIRIDPCGGDIRIVLQIVDVVEAVRGGQRAWRCQCQASFAGLAIDGARARQRRECIVPGRSRHRRLDGDRPVVRVAECAAGSGVAVVIVSVSVPKKSGSPR